MKNIDPKQVIKKLEEALADYNIQGNMIVWFDEYYDLVNPSAIIALLEYIKQLENIKEQIQPKNHS